MSIDKNPVSVSEFGTYYNTNAKKVQHLSKNCLSGFNVWSQRSHVENWLLFGKNLGENLCIDETSLSNGELYTIVTNKSDKGGKGAIIKGTKSEDVIKVLHKIPLERRNMVKEITLDMAGSMNLIVKRSFPKASRVTDRFHVQKLAYEAVQEGRIRLR